VATAAARVAERAAVSHKDPTEVEVRCLADYDTAFGLEGEVA
jgi:hypothetical protein